MRFAPDSFPRIWFFLAPRMPFSGPSGFMASYAERLPNTGHHQSDTDPSQHVRLHSCIAMVSPPRLAAACLPIAASSLSNACILIAAYFYVVWPDVRRAGRLVSTIVGAGVKLGPVRVPLPLTGRVGYLEFTYQDSDIRVTRGNRWAPFVCCLPTLFACLSQRGGNDGLFFVCPRLCFLTESGFWRLNDCVCDVTHAAYIRGFDQW